MRIKKFTEAQACKVLSIVPLQLKMLLESADAVMQEIAPDVASLYKGGCIPRYAMIEMVCDCDRITEHFASVRHRVSDVERQLRDDALGKFKVASREVKYGVVGIELSSRVFVM